MTPLHGQILRQLHQAQGGLHHLNEGQGADDSGHIRARLSDAFRASPPTLASRWRRRVHCRLLPRLVQGHYDHPAVQLIQHSGAKRPPRTGQGHDHGRGWVPAERSCAAKITLRRNGGHRGVSTQQPLPNKTVDRDTLYYRMFREHTDLYFMWTFGARDFLHHEGYLRKFNPRAREGVLIGYDDDKPTYRIYFRQTGQVTSTRNVAFIEVPPAAISTATSAGGQHSGHELELFTTGAAAA